MSTMAGGAGAGGAGAGGAGAGGAGAGGAGAGGAGAGGAGAGGAGAGGAGAGGAGGGHAGGPASSLLSSALAITHDGLSGYWDGAADHGRDPLLRLPAADDLTDLDPSRRLDMLIAELAAPFAVSGTASHRDQSQAYVPGKAKVRFAGQAICSLTAPTVAQFQSQLVWVRNYADLRFDRLAEINVQVFDSLSFFGAQAQLDAAARRRTLELVMATQRVAYMVCMRVKSLTWSPRPVDFSVRVQPVIQTPDHSTFPNGHATEAFAIATVLAHLLFPGAGTQKAIRDGAMPFRLAHRIAANRVIAGVHFPIDGAAGARLGCAIGSAIWAALTGKTRTLAVGDWAPSDADSNADFVLKDFDPGTAATAKLGACGGPVTDEYSHKIMGEWGRS